MKTLITYYDYIGNLKKNGPPPCEICNPIMRRNDLPTWLHLPNCPNEKDFANPEA